MEHSVTEATEKVSWEEKTTQKRAAELKKLPVEWLLPNNIEIINDNVMSIPASCGILSQAEIRITEEFSAVSLAQAVQKGTLKARDVAVAFCKRAAIAQQLTNCLTETFFDDAIKQGEYLDEYLEKNKRPLGPLHGVPVSIKDSFNYVGVASTIGYVSFLDNPLPTENTPLVDILLGLGAILYCKTNIPQTLMTTDSDNNIFGRTVNPHNITLNAGGSSGGEGALVALRGSILGIGTDIGGSIRIPALCCGTYGFKPSSNRIPYGGQTPASRRGSPCFPACAGPLANSYEDLEFLVRSVVNAQPWNFDASAIPMPWRELAVPLNATDLRIGFFLEEPEYLLHPPAKRAMDEASKKLITAGFQVVPLTTVPSLKMAEVYTVTGWGLDPSQRAAINIQNSGEPVIPSLWNIDRAINKLIHPKPDLYTVDDVFNLLANVAAYKSQWNKLWVDNRLDALLCPSSQTTAVPHDTFGMPPYTLLWNLLEYPAIVMPFLHADKNVDLDTLARHDDRRTYQAVSVDGAPLSVQLVSRSLHDEQLLRIGELVDASLRT